MDLQPTSGPLVGDSRRSLGSPVSIDADSEEYMRALTSTSSVVAQELADDVAMAAVQGEQSLPPSSAPHMEADLAHVNALQDRLLEALRTGVDQGTLDTLLAASQQDGAAQEAGGDPAGAPREAEAARHAHAEMERRLQAAERENRKLADENAMLRRDAEEKLGAQASAWSGAEGRIRRLEDAESRSSARASAWSGAEGRIRRLEDAESRASARESARSRAEERMRPSGGADEKLGAQASVWSGAEERIKKLEDADERSSARESARSHAEERIKQLEDLLAQCQKDLSLSRHESCDLRVELAHLKQLHTSQESTRELSLQGASSLLRTSAAEDEHSTLQGEPSQERGQTSEFLAGQSLIEESNEEGGPLLAAAYQQISVLNTQLAHLYKELTMARTEAQHLQARAVAATAPAGEETSASAPGNNVPGGATPSSNDLRQSQQVKDLVSDIQHLQLDLEYHQQKLDHMIDEKQQMMKELKNCRKELAEAKQQAEERDQMLKHRELDFAQFKKEMRSPRAGAVAGDACADPVLAALRSEAAAKDSALVVTHYELHKETLMRDQLEQKNMKLLERMQKLMMVVETMRKEKVALERALEAKERHYEARDEQCRKAMEKARQLQKSVKVSKAGKQNTQVHLELGPLDLPMVPFQHPIDAASGGGRSGASTPRTARATPSGMMPRPSPPSPYGSTR